MSQTNKAKLSHFRMKPLHERYEARVEQIRDLPLKVRRDTTINVTICPYCGETDKLAGTVKVGGKRIVQSIPLREDGYDVPGCGRRSKELVMIDCLICGAAVDPKAYSSPIWFAGDRVRTRGYRISTLQG